MICNACGLYLKARNASRPTKRNRVESGSGNNDLSSVQSLSPQDTTEVAGEGCQGSSSKGSCPGDGNCNGTGGADGCDGCPAYNNRMYKSVSSGSVVPQAAWAQRANLESEKPTPVAAAVVHDSETLPTPISNEGGESLLVSCQNCGTTVTPLWRRDENGRPICNACGKFITFQG